MSLASAVASKLGGTTTAAAAAAVACRGGAEVNVISGVLAELANIRTPAALLGGAALGTMFVQLKPDVNKRLHLLYTMLSTSAFSLQLVCVLCSTLTYTSVASRPEAMAVSAISYLSTQMQWEFFVIRSSFVYGLFSFLGALAVRGWLTFSTYGDRGMARAMMAILASSGVFLLNFIHHTHNSLTLCLGGMTKAVLWLTLRNMYATKRRFLRHVLWATMIWGAVKLLKLGPNEGVEATTKKSAEGVGVFEDISLLVRAVRLIIFVVGPQHARQVGSTMGDAGTASCLALSTLAGISEASLRRVLGAQHLLQARVDMAHLEIAEKVGLLDNSSRVRETAQSRPVNGDSDDGTTSENGSCDSFEAYQAIHKRAACHLFADESTVGRLLGTLESFFAGQGLDTTQAHDAARGWLPCPVEPDEHSHPGIKTRPQPPPCGGRTTAKASVESKGDHQLPEKHDLSGHGVAPGGGGGAFSGRKPTLLSSPEASQSDRGRESRAPSLIRRLPLEATADEQKLTGTNDEALGAAGVGRWTDPAEGRDDKYAREERTLTASSLRSEIGGNTEEGWMPRLKWPPPDLVAVDDLCKKVRL
eukprot:g15962.t1